jgi:hypothetical protein
MLFICRLYMFSRKPLFSLYTEFDKQTNRFVKFWTESTIAHIDSIEEWYDLLKNSFIDKAITLTPYERINSTSIAFHVAPWVQMTSIYADDYALWLDRMMYIVSSMKKTDRNIENAKDLLWRSSWFISKIDCVQAALDTVWSNCFFDEFNDSYTIIDYERVFDFSIDSNFILYRVVQDLYHRQLSENQKRNITIYDLYTHTGILSYKILVFRYREFSLQNYVHIDSIPNRMIGYLVDVCYIWVFYFRKLLLWKY